MKRRRKNDRTPTHVGGGRYKFVSGFKVLYTYNAMKIQIVAGKGHGKTNLSAFDAALKDAGIHNYNLIYLSSIIPPDTTVIKKRTYEAPKEEFGDRLYVVKAEQRLAETGKAIAAGLGWCHIEKDGRGVFVEHRVVAGTVKTAQEDLEDKIRTSLRDLCDARGFAHKEKDFNISISACKIKSKPACVLVAAVYTSEKWPSEN